MNACSKSDVAVPARSSAFRRFRRWRRGVAGFVGRIGLGLEHQHVVLEAPAVHPRQEVHAEHLKFAKAGRHDYAEILGFEIPWSVEQIDEACREVLRANALEDAYVRPVAWRGSEMMGVSAQNNTIHLAIATWEWPSYFDPAQRMKGIRLDVAQWRRPDPATAPAKAKAAASPPANCTTSAIPHHRVVC